MRLAILVVALLVTHLAIAGPTYVVAADGSGDFATIQEAIDATKAFPPQRITIRLKQGIYREKVKVHEWNTRLSLVGEDAEKTVITYDDHFDGIDRGRNSTFFTPTMQVDADDFVAANLTIENTAGPVGQAVALAVNANRAVFRNVRLLGNQDTLYVTGENRRVLFDECYIEGTTDFIFGSASAVFRNCRIHSKSDSYVTAASTPANANFGLVFIGATLTADEGVTAVYLGRPWREHAQTVFVDSQMGGHILQAGWHNWDNPETEKTTLYAEYDSRGPGGDPAHRVAWSRQLSADEAQGYSVDVLLQSAAYPGWWNR